MSNYLCTFYFYENIAIAKTTLKCIVWRFSVNQCRYFSYNVKKKKFKTARQVEKKINQTSVRIKIKQKIIYTLT